MFKPVNRHILIEAPRVATIPEESLIVLPDDYSAPTERFIRVTAIEAAADIAFDVKPGVGLVVDSSMIEEISLGRTNYNVILENYVLGIVY
tara:strand:+ start:497 stop:769 length:273 start_codon:yes stop_codon:yes gene_type:complete